MKISRHSHSLLASNESATGPGTLEWVLPVRHSLFSRLRALLVATDTKDRGSGKCSIEVWAEEEYGEETSELAYCRGMLCPREGRVIVLWLGRSNARTVHQRARGRRSVDVEGTQYTLAEALFGIVGAIALLFGVKIVELQAKDNGSGKLVDLYLRVGFTKRPQAQGEILWMEAPINVVARIAPPQWLDNLVPSSFEARSWMHEAVTKMRFKQDLKSLCQEPLRWNASWPTGARVIARMTPSYSSKGSQDQAITRVAMEVSLIDPYDEPLAWASANVRLDMEFCRLTWIGRQKSQPAHQKVRGRAMYEVSDSSCRKHDKVTVAMALLGVLAALAHRLGAKMLNLQALDDGSGRLVKYLHRFGLVEPLEGVGQPSQQPFLSSPCYDLMQHCLPSEWESQLPAGDMQPLPENQPKKERERRMSGSSTASLKLPPAGKAGRVRSAKPTDTEIEIHADIVDSITPPQCSAASQTPSTSAAFFKPEKQISGAASLAVALQSNHVQSEPALKPSTPSNKDGSRDSDPLRGLKDLLARKRRSLLS